VLAVAAERLPPWFWERRFLRPAAAQRLYLDALRRLPAAPRLGSGGALQAPRAFREEETDVAVVGAEGNLGGIALGLYGDRVLGVLRPDALVAMRFERLVLATGSYERLPPIPGNDLPGMLGLHAFELYARRGALVGLRAAIWGPSDRRERALATARGHGVDVVWQGDSAPRALGGRRRLRFLEDGARVGCDVFVVGAAQPAVELALQAGAETELTDGELPVLAVRQAPEWLSLSGAAAAIGSSVPDVRPADEAFACLCEDVRVRDVRRAIAEGFAHPELVKRRTGALTGPCQGKLCAALVLALLREAGAPHEPTTSRPPVRALRLSELASDA
jgi:bacterioferritin-associated ferredoxin